MTVPTTTASAIQLACAKRALLCELIVTGKVSVSSPLCINLPRVHAFTSRHLLTIPLFFCLGFNPQKIVWPKYTPTPVTRIIEKYATSYNELAKEFEAHNWANVRRAHTVAEFEKVSRLLLGVIYIYTVILTRSRFRTVTAA